MYTKSINLKFTASSETEEVPKSAENPDKNSPDLAISEVMLNTITMPSTTEDMIIPVASTSRNTSVTVTAIPFSPETLRPLPKAPPTKGNQRNGRKLKSAILTETPVKDKLTNKKKVKKPNFVSLEMYYCRSKIKSRQYLASTLNINKLHKMYIAQAEEQFKSVKASYFWRIFNISFNIGFGTPARVCA